MSVFRFRSFSIRQEKAAMKVGTDSVLLGSLAEQPDMRNALDIGTGTGLLALMLAQRFPQAKIDAVELDKEACAEAQFNVKQSPWANRLQVIESSFQEHAAHCSSRYDLIISNPPYYRSRANISIPDQQRSMARHDHALPFAALLSGSAKLLSNDGSCWFILPVREAQLLLVASKDTGLHLVHTKAIRPKASKEVNRLIMAFARQGAILKNSELVIYNEDGSHTQAYYELTKDFYLWEKQP